MERFLIRPASVRTPEVNQTQSPLPSLVPKTKLTHPATIEKWKLDWLGVEVNDRKTYIFCKACRSCAQRVAAKVINPAQANSSADYIKVSKNIKKYVSFRHQATK